MPTRRTICFHLGLAAATLAVGSRAAAQSYPDRSIKIVVGFPPGQATDTSARNIAAKMAETLKQTIFIDNRPGAGGSISHEAVKNAVADGYTLVMGSSGSLAINPALYRKLPYDPLKDFEPIGTVSASPLALFTATATPVGNVSELIAYVKARPGKVSYGSPGNGTTAHIAMEMFKQAAGLDMLHVPYKGSPPMITDAVSGLVQFAFDATASIVPFSQSGRVKLLGVTSAKRMPALPDLPTIAEQGVPGFEAMAWTGLLAPKGTPAPVIEALNAALNKALKHPDILAQLALTGSQPMEGTPADFRRFLQSEIARWGKAVKASGAQVD